MGGNCASYSTPSGLFPDDYQLGSYVLGSSWWFSRVKRTYLGGHIFFNNLREDFFHIKSNTDI